MKLIKLSDTHYVIVDDYKINKYFEGFCLDNEYNIRNGKSDLHTLSICKRITHSTIPLERAYGQATYGVQYTEVFNQITQLNISDVERVVNGYNIEELAAIRFDKKYTNYKVRQQGYIEGFKAHKELVKDNIFTIQNIKEAITASWIFSQGEGNNLTDCMDLIIKTLSPKTEWDITIDENGYISKI